MLLLVTLLLTVCGLIQGQSRFVNTKYGLVEGHTVPTHNGQSVLSFLGVPFARPPIDDLRWAPPQEPEPWQDTFVADTLGNICHQESNLFIPVTHPDWDRVNEDCLNLNIFTPFNAPEPGPYPVMVYFHGGGYTVSANIQYPGHFYAQRGVIMVIPNYRLGRMGFLASGGTDNVKGNQAFFDQLQVLRFVRENIANFGGDPNRVTIYGQSAGGWSVGYHIVSPMSRGLFAQSMMISGTDMMVSQLLPCENSANITRQIAINIQCTADPPAAMMACLRSRDIEEIFNATYDIYPEDGILGLRSCVDGPGGFLPETPLAYRQRGDFAKVPLLAGKTDKEGGIGFLAVEDGYNSTEFREYIRDRIELMYGVFGETTVTSVQKAVEFQYTPWPHIENRENNRDQLIELNEDLGFGGSTDEALKIHASHGLTTYQYIFSFQAALIRDLLPPWIGVAHIFDIPFYQGHALLDLNPEVLDDMEITNLPYNQTDMDYADYWVDLIANYAKYGHPTPVPHPAPGGNNDTMWEPFTMEAMNYIDVNDVIQTKKDYRHRYYHLWRDYIPWLVNHTALSPVANIPGSTPTEDLVETIEDLLQYQLL